LDYLLKAREISVGLGRHTRVATYDSYIGFLYYELENDSLIYDMIVKRKFKGHPNVTYNACFVNKSDSALQSRASESLDERIFNRESIEIFNSDWIGGVIDYYSGNVEIIPNVRQGRPLFLCRGMFHYGDWLI
jgi:hypothetical protein